MAKTKSGLTEMIAEMKKPHFTASGLASIKSLKSQKVMHRPKFKPST
jgi:hypothetical protein